MIATTRTPREDVAPRSDRLRVLALDVTKSESIAAVLETCPSTCSLTTEFSFKPDWTVEELSDEEFAMIIRAENSDLV